MANCDLILADFYYNSSSTEDADSCCWYFGDGIKKCTSHSDAASHTYSTPGIYTVKLTLWKNGVEKNIIKNDLIKVYNPPIPSFNIFILDSSRFAPLTVDFENKTISGDCQELTYSWDFGDGHLSSEINPTHLYINPNTYYVILNVTDTLNCDKSISDYVIVKDTAQKGEFELNTSGCYIEGQISPCGYDRHFELKDDSLIIFGFYYGNCGTYKTATIRYSGDTIKIKTWEVGPLTTCYCGYCFEIVVPNITQDSVIILFNDEIVPYKYSNMHDQKNVNSSLKVFPNPVNDILTIYIQDVIASDCEYKILDINGKIIQKGLLNKYSQVRLKDIAKGTYLIRVLIKTHNTEYITRFIKN
ncbi:MAG: PKD domain-containing protein [Clostridiales bacterium]|nr:PKD domain-containing protein [Clostridiales bacterium]